METEKRKAIIVDLDGTLCNTGHREHHINGEKKNWPAFNEACGYDTPNMWCVDIIKGMKSRHDLEIIFITGRSLEYFDTTVGWIEQHANLGSFSIFMRPERDYRKDIEVKKELYESQVKGQYEVLFVIEDRKQVVDMWRELGLVCLQCAAGEY